MSSQKVHYDACPLGHSKLDTTALYARVATKTIRSVISPLERLATLMQSEEPSD
jgi:hypothetical protein